MTVYDGHDSDRASIQNGRGSESSLAGGLILALRVGESTDSTNELATVHAVDKRPQQILCSPRSYANLVRMVEFLPCSCFIHASLEKKTPAMKSGLADSAWSIWKLLTEAAIIRSRDVY